jgi:hypothetical protein
MLDDTVYTEWLAGDGEACAWRAVAEMKPMAMNDAGHGSSCDRIDGDAVLAEARLLNKVTAISVDNQALDSIIRATKERRDEGCLAPCGSCLCTCALPAKDIAAPGR